jgi:hypothetical protein
VHFSYLLASELPYFWINARSETLLEQAVIQASRRQTTLSGPANGFYKPISPNSSG